jgi:hypothetical protein
MKCIVCNKENPTGRRFCKTCARSYDRLMVYADGTTAGLIYWAARRARRFERERQDSDAAKRRQRILDEYPDCPCCGYGMPGPHAKTCPLHGWR